MATPCNSVSWFVGASAAWLSWVLRGVIRGFSEEARTRGFPSPSFGGFGFIVVPTKYSRKLPDCPIVNRIGTYTGSGIVPFGSRLCDNEWIFLTDGTAHHNDFCWRLGDEMHSHMRTHSYALNGIFLADTTEALSSALQFPEVKNKTSIQEK